MSNTTPDGYEFISGRGRENALKALSLAEERGFSAELVRVDHRSNGFLVPFEKGEEGDAGEHDEASEAEDADESLEDLTVAELKAKAAEQEIDLGDATKKADIIAAIQASEKIPTIGSAEESTED